MITVRFPSGFSIQYNDLCAMKWGHDGAAMLFRTAADRDANKGWVVSVPRERVIEFVRPCRTYSANGAPDDVVATVQALSKEVRSLKRKLGKVN